MFPEGARPSPPASCAPRSLRMSPKRLQVTMTSNCRGSRTISIASVSIKRWRDSMSAYSWRTSLKTRCHRPCAKVMALDLSLVKQLHGPRVDVEVQLESQAKQNIGSVLIGGDARVAQGPKKNGVKFVAQ